MIKAKPFNRITLTAILLAIIFVTTFTLASCNKDDDNPNLKLDPENPVTIEIWYYYSGAQATEFDALVENFNNTVGREKGIIVSTTAQSNINNLADELLNAVDGKVGAQTIPDVAAIYPETAYILKEKNAIVPVQSYLTNDEWAEYIPSFLESGRFSTNGDIYGFPISKSTEILVYNATDWAAFQTAKGYKIDEITTAEDLAVAAQAYYEWTDSLTPDIREDGKALYGRDSMANYIYVGAAKLGHEITKINADGTVNVNLDKATFRTLWNNYYLPYINGYYAHSDKFRSGDMKTGKILACTGSTSSANYISEFVKDTDESSHDITLAFKKPLQITGQTSEIYVQQGASYYVMKSSDVKQYAAAQFLKWFTAKEQNVQFSVNVGYSPVKKDANTEAAITEAMEKSAKPSAKVLSTLKISADIFNNQTTYASPAFNKAKELREYIENTFLSTLTTDRAAVVAAIESGSTRADAVANFSSDAYFDTKYTDMTVQIATLIK